MRRIFHLLIVSIFFFAASAQAAAQTGYVMPKSANIGDAFQAIAAKRFLPADCVAIDRDLIHQFHWPHPVKAVVSGWFMHTKEGGYWERSDVPVPLESWPPSHIIHPLLISMHITGSFFPQAFTPEGIQYFKDHGPVGARDYFTLNELQKRGIPSYFSGCLTLTLEKTTKGRNNIIYLVDLDDACVQYIKARTRSQVVVLTHGAPIANTKQTLKYAENLLNRYQKAKCVVTARLHAAMPCLAYETPVLFIGTPSGPRFDGLIEHTRNCTAEDLLQGKANYNFDNPPANPNTHLAIRENLIQIMKEWAKE